jgi:hypothetical protein
MIQNIILLNYLYNKNSYVKIVCKIICKIVCNFLSRVSKKLKNEKGDLFFKKKIKKRD